MGRGRGSVGTFDFAQFLEGIGKASCSYDGVDRFGNSRGKKTKRKMSCSIFDGQSDHGRRRLKMRWDGVMETGGEDGWKMGGGERNICLLLNCSGGVKGQIVHEPLFCADRKSTDL